MHRIDRHRLLYPILVATLLGGCTEEKKPWQQIEPGLPAAPSKGAVAPPADPYLKLVTDLSVLATGRPLAGKKAKAEAAKIREDKGAVNPFIAKLLANDDFGRKVARGIVLGGSQSTKKRHPLPQHSILSSSTVDGQKIYHLRGACPLDQTEAVEPWWAPGTQIRVCPKAHRPKVFADAKGRSCGSLTLGPRSADVCGCGPRMMFCTRDTAHYNAVRSALQNEVKDTLALVINSDRPIDDLFTMNETVRTRAVEVIYRRAEVAAGADPSRLNVTGFDSKKGKLAPRKNLVPDQHAGLLTTPSLIFSSDALRGVMRNYFDYLWCVGQASSKVTTQAVLGLGVVDLRSGDGWKQLASMPICTDCHARMDYGMQFFHGYPSAATGIDFRPSLSLKGAGPMYGDDIKDPRGSAQLNPRAFAKLVLAEGEFSECMTSKVVNHIFSGGATEEDFDAAFKVFKETRRIKPTFKVALERFAAASLGSPARAPAQRFAAAATPDAQGLLKISDPLRESLDMYCSECHDTERYANLDGHALGRDLLLHGLEQVAFSVMPKTAEGMPDDARAELVDLLIGTLWRKPAERAEARSFYQGALSALPVHRYYASMKVIASRAGSKRPKSIAAVEPAVPQTTSRYSPGFAATSAVAAIKACRLAKAKGAEFERCVSYASDPSALIVGSIRPKAPAAPAAP